MYNICVTGSGYVGLVTGACLADFGNRVRCVDVDESKIERLKRSEVPFYGTIQLTPIRTNSRRW